MNGSRNKPFFYKLCTQPVMIFHLLLYALALNSSGLRAEEEISKEEAYVESWRALNEEANAFSAQLKIFRARFEGETEFRFDEFGESLQKSVADDSVAEFLQSSERSVRRQLPQAMAGQLWGDIVLVDKSDERCRVTWKSLLGKVADDYLFDSDIFIRVLPDLLQIQFDITGNSERFEASHLMLTPIFNTAKEINFVRRINGVDVFSANNGEMEIHADPQTFRVLKFTRKSDNGLYTRVNYFKSNYSENEGCAPSVFAELYSDADGKPYRLLVTQVQDFCLGNLKDESRLKIKAKKGWVLVDLRNGDGNIRAFTVPEDASDAEVLLTELINKKEQAKPAPTTNSKLEQELKQSSRSKLQPDSSKREYLFCGLLTVVGVVSFITTRGLVCRF